MSTPTTIRELAEFYAERVPGCDLADVLEGLRVPPAALEQETKKQRAQALLYHHARGAVQGAKLSLSIQRLDSARAQLVHAIECLCRAGVL